jgi:hypothetical protein
MKKVIILIVVVAVIVVGWLAFFKKSGPKVSSFVVEPPSLILTGEKIAKAEVWAIQTNADGKADSFELGAMELQEADAQGMQTWTLTIPAKPAQPITHIEARAYDEKNGETTTVLQYTTAEEIAAAVWPPQPENVIPGTVKSISGSKIVFIMDVPAGSTLNVTLAKDAKVVDAKGKATTFATIKKGSRINLIGDFTDDIEFTATQIELVK